MADAPNRSLATGRLRRLRHDDLPLVLSWRNHSDIRRFMRRQREIGPDEHLAWFKRMSGDPSEHLLVYEVEGKLTGFAKLCQIDGSQVADWGFYAAPDAPRGTGMQLGIAVLDFAFAELGLHKVCGQVLGFNERSLRFHQKLGFRDEGVLRDQYFDGENYHSVFCFGLLAAEWKAGLEVG